MVYAYFSTRGGAINQSPLTYLRWLTDDFGVWQHALDDQRIDRTMGYALDDSARALIVYLLYGDRDRAEVCLRYLETSQTAEGFTGFFDEHRSPLDERSSGDAHALAVWALATAVSHGFETDRARAVLARGRDVLPLDSPYLRPLAYLLLAFCELGDLGEAGRLVGRLRRAFQPGLGWFEERLIYANAVLPWALMRYRRAAGGPDDGLDEIIQRAMATLEEHCRIGVIPAPVGNRIWQQVGAVGRDVYGQQPIDAGFMVLAHGEAYRLYGDPAYARNADDWMEWFYGNNVYRTNLISGAHGCADGLDEPARAVNPRKGAESVILYLWARHAHQALRSEKVGHSPPMATVTQLDS